jgi:hypothetical protein
VYKSADEPGGQLCLRDLRSFYDLLRAMICRVSTEHLTIILPVLFDGVFYLLGIDKRH